MAGEANCLPSHLSLDVKPGANYTPQSQVSIISGWVIVGTQHSHNTIRNALEAQHAARAHPRPRTGNFVFTLPGLQRGLVVVDRTMNGLSPQVQLVQPTPNQHAPYPNQAQAFQALGPGHRGRLTWCGLTVAGDESGRRPDIQLCATVHLVSGC